MAAPHIILFDGDCAYCNGWVKWIIKRDSGQRFTFASLTSDQGLALRRKHRIPEHLDSIVLVDGDEAFTRSDAAWRVLTSLPGHAFQGVLLRLVPRPLRNWGYDLVARNRHRFGMKDECEVPAR